jgi:2-succinyl-6-hydroxy-2,4-cyclohexadiene-1-carboxylate synthase
MPVSADPGRRLVFLHGFTQTHHHWHAPAHRLAERLGGDPTLAFVDLPGHGLSGSDRATVDGAADELVRLAGGGTWVGYSMGGRFALHAALGARSPIDRLVLVGATAGIEDRDARAERRRLDDGRADRVERIGIDAFLDEWLAAPLFATLGDAGREHRLGNTASGLAHSLRTAGTGVQASLWPRLGEVTVPVLVLAGALDAKFTGIGRRLADELPNASFATIPDAGHAAHTERPDEFAGLVADWLTG